jgi:hypothetical protein
MDKAKGIRFIAFYCTAVGILMGIQWLFFLVTGNVSEVQTEPLSIAFHLVAEFATASLLLIAGVGLLRSSVWALHMSLIALGMLLYTVINSAGYFAQRAQWEMVAMFSVLLLLTSICLYVLVSHAHHLPTKR